MGCCRSSLTYDPKKFLSIENYISASNTSQNKRNPGERRKSTVKINLREKVDMLEGHLYQYYEIGEILGEGAFGCVRKGVQLVTGQEVAIKSLLKSYAQRSDSTNAIIEVEILRTLDHPNILKIRELVEDSRNYHIITELCTGGELFAKILSMRSLSESEAAGYMMQLLAALSFCHSHGVLHRDIKPENILFQADENDSPLKIIDFGVSNLGHENFLMNSKQYTSIFYRAPEQFNGMCNEKSDLWSCGVIMYLMLSGYLPFKGKNEKQMSLSISTQELSFPSTEWEEISQDAKDLLSHMLEKDINLRWTAKEAFKHPWIQNRHCQYFLARSVSHSGFLNLAKFRSDIKLRHAVLEFITCHFTNSKEISELQQTFIAMDYNGDGRLSREELTVACLLHDFSNNEVQTIMNECDANMNGYLDYTEFLTSAINWKKLLNQNKLKMAFNAFDLNKDGFICINELKQMLITDNIVEEEVWNEVFNQADSNSDGKIDMSEFEKAVLTRESLAFY